MNIDILKAIVRGLFAIVIAIVLTCLLAYCGTRARAQVDPRPEFRIVNHWQRFRGDRSMGFAAYVNEPDTTHGGPRIFGVAGMALRDKKQTRWLEIMGGGLGSRTGFDAALDVRAQVKLLKLHGLTPWGECLHLFKSNITLLSGAITQPISKRFGLRIESDTWIQTNGHQTGIGPGLTLSFNKHVQLVSAYQFGVGKQRDIWRTYLIVNW